MSLLFDAAGTDNATATITAFTDADYTYGAWAYLVTARAASMIFDVDAAAISKQYLLLNLDRTINAYQHHDTALGNAATATSTTVALTTWTLLAAVFTASDNKIRIYTGTPAAAMAEAAYSGASPVAGTGTFQGGGTHLHIGADHAADDGFLGRIAAPFGVQKALSVAQLEAIRLGVRSILPASTPRFGFPFFSAEVATLTDRFAGITATGTGLTAADHPPMRPALV